MVLACTVLTWLLGARVGSFQTRPGVMPDQRCATLQQRYKEETFVHVMDKGGIPHTRHVRGSNYNLISVFPDRLTGRAIIISGTGSSAPQGVQYILQWFQLPDAAVACVMLDCMLHGTRTGVLYVHELAVNVLVVRA